MWCCCWGTLCDLAVDVPPSFLQVFDGVALEVGAPDILDGVAETKAHVLGYLDALDTRRVGGVMLRAVDGVGFGLPMRRVAVHFNMPFLSLIVLILRPNICSYNDALSAG